MEIADVRMLYQWIPELQHFAPGIPIVLVGTKLGKSGIIYY